MFIIDWWTHFCVNVMHKYGEEKKIPPLSPPELMVTFPKKKTCYVQLTNPGLWEQNKEQQIILFVGICKCLALCFINDPEEESSSLYCIIAA